MKRFLFSAVTLLLLGFLLKYPREALAASRDGLDLWLNTLLPTLLPFMILTNILIRTEAADKIAGPAGRLWKKLLGVSPSGAYAFILGLLCGYPMGRRSPRTCIAAERSAKEKPNISLPSQITLARCLSIHILSISV